MATYKVIQDIEAEDKLLGPLSLRQFLYAAIVVVLGFIGFKLITVQPLLIAPLLPPMLLFGILAAPFGRDQSSEIWLLAKIRFFIKPRGRIWDQDGTQELVTVTAPKKIEKHLIKDLNQTQVRSRLQALAQTIDTRGWAIKGLDVNLATQPLYGMDQTDRLVEMSSLTPNEVPDVQLQATDDIFDTQRNPLAQQMGQLVQTHDASHRQAVLAQMQQIRAQQNNGTPGDATMPVYTTFNTQTVQPGMAQVGQPAPAAMPTVDDQLFLARVHDYQERQKQEPYSRMHMVQPPGHAPASAQPQAPMATTPDPGLVNNDDLTVATIARQANRKRTPPGGDEVVVSLR
jgi:hypothetical protein